MLQIPQDKHYVVILFRHGDKSNKSPVRGGELTLLGRQQVWSTSIQILQKFGQFALSHAIFFHSPVPRVRQSKNIALAAFGRDPDTAFEIEELEWGPDTGDKNDIFIANELFAHTSGGIVVALGHNGLFENIAQRIFPRNNGYQIKPGEALIMTPSGIETITPLV